MRLWIVSLTPTVPSDARGTLIEVTVASAQGSETYKVTVVRPLKPPLLWSLVGTPGDPSCPFLVHAF